MSLASRIEKLESKLQLEEVRVTFLGWRGCEWKYSNGLIRDANETKEQFFKRIAKTSSSKFIWCY